MTAAVAAPPRSRIAAPAGRPEPPPIGTPLPADRAAAVAAARAYLGEVRAGAERALTSHGGLACATYLAAGHDAAIVALVEATRAGTPAAARERCAVVAVGGYGRGALAPGSDIDILMLYPNGAASTKLAEGLLYALWDLGLKVGHATRGIDECLRAAAGDLTIRTALLEARLLDGDAGLFAEFSRRFSAEVIAGTASAFAQGKLAERDERLEKSGNSRYLVEPNVKEGKGGLRDLNTLFWIGKYTYDVRSAEQLVAAGLFTRREFESFRRCEEFLWRTRCQMHFAAGRAEERLTFDLQRIVADRLGYRASPTASAVERFMKHYFMVAKEVGDLTAIVCAALEAQQAKPGAMLDRFVAPFRRRRKPLSGEIDFVLESGRIAIAHDAVFRERPIQLIRIFRLADRHNLALHPATCRVLSRSLKLIDQTLREDAEANRLFLDILTSDQNPEATLRRMHETGVLGRFVPEFGRIQALMQFSMYHHYTVDEHTLRAIGAYNDLANGRLKGELPLTTELLPSIKNKRVVQVALFLHDIGKGRRQDHSLVGARIARSLCPRFGLTPAETETVAWLIENHLAMSVTSQTRDIGDPRTILTFADTVQTLERLKLLLALTVCDIRAVGPGVWNGWKGQLLRNLYWETEVVLAGGHSAVDRKARIEGAKAALAAHMKGFDPAALQRFVDRQYPAYWLKVDLERQAKHARLLDAAERDGERFVTATATDAFTSVTELTIFAIDHPRLLAIVTGACAAAGANIVSAEIFTTNDGHALDTIFISRAFERDEDELRRAERVASHIVKALKGEIALPDAVAVRANQARGPKPFRVPPQVAIDNAISQRYSVVEVTGLDRPGVLYELTTALGKLNLNIASAKITTYGEKVVDAFYVCDLTGGKIVDPARQALIVRRLTEVFEPAAPEPSSGRA
jgi:[protein-PII] uridylyltransferase